MAEHAWCHDIARDAAVRAAEDGRTGPLPTLGEAIASPFAEAAEGSSPVSETAEPQSGMRTERITLEVTQDSHLSLCDWPSLRTFFGESVRVVTEAHFDDLAQVAMERDAAIREREDSVAFWKGELRSRTAERDAARARVAELESQLESVACRAATAETALDAQTSTAGEGSCVAQAASGGGEQPRGWLSEEEREAVEFLASLDAPPCVDAARKAARIGKELLARSSPPEVVLPKLHTRCEVNEANHKSPCLWFRRPDVIEALAAAGVAVKLPTGAGGNA
jgi:hypothetical protein